MSGKGTSGKSVSGVSGSSSGSGLETSMGKHGMGGMAGMAGKMSLPKHLQGHPLVEHVMKQTMLDTHNFLGDSGIKVSKICLGTMNFGQMDKTYGDRPGQLNEQEAHKVLDRYLELGGNFIDTGNFYPWFGTSVGESERIIGTWLAK